MAEGYELQTGYAVVDSLLINNTPVRDFFDVHVYPYLAPQNLEERFCVFRFPSGIPLYVVGDLQVWVEAILDVEVVGERDDLPDAIEEGAASVHLALQGQRDTAPNGQVLHIKRTDVFDRPYEPSTGLYPRRIQRYRVYAK
jgi:hypothetical protein